jgi:PAS domain S-box-containing protein
MCHTAVDFRTLFESAPGLYLVLTPDLQIVAVSDAYLRATMTRREEILGRGLFEVFPDNPDDQDATGVSNLKASLYRVLKTGAADTMAVQKYDIRRPESEGGAFEVRYWSPVNSPVRDADGEVAYIIHQVEDVTETVRRSRELEEATRRNDLLEILVERSPVGVAMLDRDLCYLRTSRRWREQCGLGERESKGKSRHRFFPDLPEHWKAGHRRVLAGESISGEDQFAGFDGKLRSVLWEMHPWGDAGSKTGGIIIFSVDVTSRRQAEEALRENEERFRSLYEHAAVGIQQVGVDGKVLMVNPALCRMLGYSESEMLARTITEITHPDDRDSQAALLDELLRGDRDCYDMEKRYLHRNGSAVWVSLTSSLVKDGSGLPLYRISVIQDITERKRVDEALRANRERLEAIIGSARDAIITVDENQRIILFNSAAERILRCPAAEAIGGPLDRFLPERFRRHHAGHVDAYGKTGVSARDMGPISPMYGRRADGEEFPIQASISQVHSGGQKLYTVILQDITQSKQREELERKYEHAKELDRLKTEFFANISHELRTPLTLILGPVRKRLADDGTAGQERSDLKLVERNARLLLRHVNDLLDLSKLDAGRMTVEYAEADLALLLRLIVSNFDSAARERRIDFTVEAPISLQAEIDPGQIERVILNLVSNALKFSPDGVRVRLALRADGDRAILEVDDNGPGIPPHLREAVFERFRQLDSGLQRGFGGTGLGLSIVKQFVELHGGRITVEDPDWGTGTRFRVDLPLAAPAGSVVVRAARASFTDSAMQAAEELKVRAGGKRRSTPPALPGQPTVLLVEDNPEMNDFIATTLGDEFRVVPTFDGQEGLEAATELHPDLILCDVMMPRMSGDQLVRELRRRRDFDDVPIVLLTAKADEGLQVTLLKEGAQDFLRKPFNGEQLVAKVERLIADRQRSAGELRDVRRVTGDLLEVRDRERQEVARELHENTIQSLAALEINLSMARESIAALSPEMQRVLTDALAMLELCSSEIQSMCYILYPPLLDHFGLPAAMKLHIRGSRKRCNVRAIFSFPKDFGRLPAEHELALFRIMQEGLINVSRSSVNRAAKVRLFRTASEVGIEVTERAHAGLEESRSASIAALRERMRHLGGRLEMVCGGRRATLLATLPCTAPLVARSA